MNPMTKTVIERMTAVHEAMMEAEAQGENFETLQGITTAGDNALLGARLANKMAAEAKARFATYKQPTPEQRENLESVLRENAPEVAVFGRAAGVDDVEVKEAQSITKDELARGSDRSPEEERIYRAMPGNNDPTVTLKDMLDARLATARLVAAASLAHARSFNFDKSVNSDTFLEQVDKLARDNVNSGLDDEYGRGTAAAIANLRSEINIDSEIRHAEAEGASPDRIADLRAALRDELVADDVSQGDERFRLVINLLPEPLRSDFFGVLDNEQNRDLTQQSTQQVGYQAEDRTMVMADATGGHQAEYDARRQGVIENGRKEYQTDELARANYDDRAQKLDERFEVEAKQMVGRISPLAVQERLEIALIRGESDVVDRLQAGLDLARKEGRDVTLADISGEQKPTPSINVDNSRRMVMRGGQMIVPEPGEDGIGFM